MRYPFILRRIVHPHILADDPDSPPCRQHKQFQFSLIAGSNHSHPWQPVERIKPVACLGIFQREQRLDEEPEVAERIGELAASAALGFLQACPFSDDEGTWMATVSLQEQRDIFRIMLAVCIDRDGI